MSNKKYTVVIVPEDDAETRRFSISRRIFRIAVVVIIILFLGNIGFIIFFLPRAVDYIKVKKQHQTMMEERVKVAQLLSDLKRMKQMENYIRQTLGIDIEFPLEHDASDLVGDDFSPKESDNLYISFIENIPSTIPVKGFITQDFPSDGYTTVEDHPGMDIAATEGSAVSAAASGLVVFSGWTYPYGNLVILYHGDEYFSLYGHNQRNLVSVRQQVERGEVISLVGQTGIATGPHLHFEVWKNGGPVDPKLFVNEYRLLNLSPHRDGE
ncbi:MAG: M23 family metallopeptidase [Candidatus Marinimicrobia bacterium]|nr:M23 family metallopeptidase [Candidatus Neomarinimicrobiota bacterium]